MPDERRASSISPRRAGRYDPLVHGRCIARTLAPALWLSVAAMLACAGGADDGRDAAGQLTMDGSGGTSPGSAATQAADDDGDDDGPTDASSGSDGTPSDDSPQTTSGQRRVYVSTTFGR